VRGIVLAARRAGPAALVLTGALAILALLVLTAGASPSAALAALGEGAAGSKAALGETLTRSTGLILCALAATVAFRAGVLNIGIEGQFLMGAAAAAAAGSALQAPPLLARSVLLVAAAGAGALATAPALWLAGKRRVPPVLSTILLNLVAAAAVGGLVRGALRDPAGDYPQSRPLPDTVRFEPLFAGSRTTAAFFIAVVLAGAAAVVLSKTPLGLKLRAVGASPVAARAIGLPEAAIRTGAFALSGALAGLAGGLEVAAVTGRLYDPFSAGVGYSGIAASLLGGTAPLGGTAAAAFFAALGAGSSAIQRETGVPASLASIVPGVLVLAVLLARARGRKA
jgi:simple sugar transport system permease protein